MLEDLKKNRLPIAASGLSNIHKSVISGALQQHLNKKILLIADDEASANLITEDLLSLGVNARNLPLRDYNLAKLKGVSKEYEHKRIDTLSKVLDGDFDVLTASVDACIQFTVPPEVLRENTFCVSVADTVDLSALGEKLVNAGYTRSELTEGPGHFSIRGGIIDIFPSNSPFPARIELWGDEVDSISYFDPLSQRRTEGINILHIAPACELPYNRETLGATLNELIKSNKKFTDKQRAYIEQDINLLSGGVNIIADC